MIKLVYQNMYLKVPVAQKQTELQIFGCHLWKTYFLKHDFFGQLILANWSFYKIIYLDNWFFTTHFFAWLIFWATEFLTTDILSTDFLENLLFWQLNFLTINCFDSLSNYPTDQQGVLDSRPLLLLTKQKKTYDLLYGWGKL